MSLPGFTAEVSLYRKETRYQAAAPGAGAAGVVTPQQGDAPRRRTWISCYMQRVQSRTFFCCTNHDTGETQCSEISV